MGDRTAPSIMALQLSCRGNAMRERILRDWISFSESRGELPLLQSLPKAPNGTPIDWVRLYEEVVAKGGYQYVSRNGLWSAIASRECLGIDIMPYMLAVYYERHLLPFEEKQLFGRDVPPTHPTVQRPLKRAEPEADDDSVEQIATTSELQEAQSVRSTPLPPPSKKLKASARTPLDLGTLQGLVLALDSELPRETSRAINLLNVLSYGTPGADSDNDFLLDNVPGLLDALYRQLLVSRLVPHAPPAPQPSRRELLNLDIHDGQRELLDTKALLVLNIIRNLSMVPDNERALADHEDLVVFLIVALRELDRHAEIGDHVLDILCAIARRIDFLALHPPAKLELWHPSYQLAAHLWTREKVLPLECLLRHVTRLMQRSATNGYKRSVVLRACELFCQVTRDVSVRPMLAASAALADPVFVDSVVGLLASTRQDFRYSVAFASRRRLKLGHVGSRRRQHMGVKGDDALDVDGEDDDDDEDDDDHADEPEDESTKWPAPWESDGLPSSVGMGIVYVTPDGSRSALFANAGADDDVKLDHEMRDAALEVIYRLSDTDDATKLRLARHPHCLLRLTGILTSCIGRPEAARIAVAALSSISMNRDTFPYFLAVEKDLLLLSCSDRSVADILNNVVADVYGMHSL
ncbi:hypothetical protein P43SY_009414 [Pythium insidiosum]|uniref:ARID domain-containing protein n=1 Tax=Pythium insidiosum TaxID=114742 RepID=A0AAD5QC53_PYTIN|nr:hypothetical protein P43SY_009414 [Pythium insidiosum]